MVRADMRELAGCARIADAAPERHGGVATLLNGAAGGQHLAAAEVITPQGWAAVRRPNIDGTTQMSASRASSAGSRRSWPRRSGAR